MGIWNGLFLIYLLSSLLLEHLARLITIAESLFVCNHISIRQNRDCSIANHSIKPTELYMLAIKINIEID